MPGRAALGLPLTNLPASVHYLLFLRRSTSLCSNRLFRYRVVSCLIGFVKPMMDPSQPPNSLRFKQPRRKKRTDRSENAEGILKKKKRKVRVNANTHHRFPVKRKPIDFLLCSIRTLFIRETNKGLSSHTHGVMCYNGRDRTVWFEEV